jgi:hypothetical protein
MTINLPSMKMQAWISTSVEKIGNNEFLLKTVFDKMSVDNNMFSDGPLFIIRSVIDRQGNTKQKDIDAPMFKKNGIDEKTMSEFFDKASIDYNFNPVPVKTGDCANTLTPCVKIKGMTIYNGRKTIVGDFNAVIDQSAATGYVYYDAETFQIVRSSLKMVANKTISEMNTVSTF